MGIFKNKREPNPVQQSRIFSNYEQFCMFINCMDQQI